MSCIFCRIVAGEVPSHKVHEDDWTLAFLDAFPLARGHVLVVPKRHAPLLDDLSEDESSRLFEVVRILSPRARDAVGATATTIAMNNGSASGQEVPHLHVHIVPRKEGDGGGPIHAIMRARPQVPKEEMSSIAAAIRGPG
jgi:histidine triad (HIT) family protein